MNREQELNYIVERFAQKFKESQHKYPFLSDPKIQEGFLKLLAETIMEDSQLLNALNELGYDKVKTLLQPLINQAFAKMEEKIEEAKKEVKEEIKKEAEDLKGGQKAIVKGLGELADLNIQIGKDILGSMSKYYQNLQYSISDVKSAVEDAKKTAQDLSWLNSRTY